MAIEALELEAFVSVRLPGQEVAFAVRGDVYRQPDGRYCWQAWGPDGGRVIMGKDCASIDDAIKHVTALAGQLNPDEVIH